MLWNSWAYYIGDGLLNPQHFATGLLCWLDHSLFQFAGAPSNLEGDIWVVDLTQIAERFIETMCLQRRSQSGGLIRGRVAGRRRLLDDVDKTGAGPISLRRGDFIMRGLKAFLDATANEGNVGLDLVERGLRETRERIARAYGQGRAPKVLEALSEMGDDEACEAFMELLAAA
ncbi:hypothetical protein F5Y09DRAFT_338172 [Xylaria sp. FL1042]|nr:hypothetical protein F5Y09DRAFT_338172 [Xylaria sp. FL1042]